MHVGKAHNTVDTVQNPAMFVFLTAWSKMKEDEHLLAQRICFLDTIAMIKH